MQVSVEKSFPPAPDDLDLPEKGELSMFCTHCGTKNGLDANFCKQCGDKLERHSALKLSEAEFADLKLPDDRVSDLLVTAFRKESEDDVEAAIAICSQALAIRPESTSAHSLLGMLYEKQGQREKAIAEFEEVLKLNPGSIADREKLEQLRDATTSITPRKITSRQLTGPRFLSTPNGAVAAAAAVFLLVLCIGAWAVWLRGNQTALGKSGGTGNSTANSQIGAPGPGQSTPNAVQQSAQNSQQGAQQAPQQYAGYPPQYYTGYPPYPYPYPNWQTQNPAPQNGAAARPVPRSESSEVKPAPVLLSRPQSLEAYGRNQRPASNSVQTPQNNTIHLPDAASEGTQGGANPGNGGAQGAPSRPNYGKVEIIVSDGNAKTGSAGTAPGSPNASMDSRGRKANAQQLQLAGKYDVAVREYLKALDGAGDDAAIIYQQIGLCYQRLGDNDSAIANYRNAISEYQKLIAANRNTDSATRGIKTCETAIRAIQ